MELGSEDMAQLIKIPAVQAEGHGFGLSAPTDNPGLEVCPCGSTQDKGYNRKVCANDK